MIEWIVTSSALILLVLVLRLIVRERISPRLRYALWGLVLLRLLIPGTVFESRASVMSPVAAREVYQEIERVPRYVRETSDGRVEIGHPNSGSYTSIPAESAVLDEPVRFDWFSETEDVRLETLREQVNVRNAFLLIWLTGGVLTGSFLLVVNLKFSGDLKKQRRTVEQYRGLWVFVMEGLSTPCLFGLFRPSIYLTPSVSADEAAKAHVLAHEYTHFRQGDHVWTLLRSVCLALHWYNPLVWLAAVLSRRDCELSCDEGAVRLLGEERRADYGRTLVGLVARRTTAADLARCATTMTGGKSALKERVAILVKRPKTTAVMAVIVAAACAWFAVCTFTGAAEAEASDVPQAADSPAGLPSLDELPTQVIDAYTLGDLAGNIDPYWLLDQLDEEDIALYGVNPMGKADEIKGIYLRYGEHLQYFDQQVSPYIYVRPHLTWYDFDGDGDNELLVVYAIKRATTMDVSELVVYEWEGGQWSEHKYDPSGLMEDFNANAVFESDGDMSRISYQGRDVQVALGGGECFFDGGVVTYTIYGKDGWGILMNLWGQIGPTLTSTNYAFDYMCDIYYHPDGTFTEGGGIFSSLYEPEDPLPALADLPTEIVADPVEGYDEPVLLMAELPAEDIAIYSEQQSGNSLIRYGGHLQRVAEHLAGRTPPELTFEDLDGDGEKELAVIYNTGWGTGVYTTALTVYEWDAGAGQWTGHTARLEEDAVADFNVSRTFTLYPSEGRAVVGYAGDEVEVDMGAMFPGRTEWRDSAAVCEMTGLFSCYSMEGYGLALTISGEIRPEEYAPTTCYAFDYICNIYYEEDGTFRSTWGYLDTDYLWSPKMDEGRLTNTFRRILRDFMRETLEEIPGMDEASLSNDAFAICDVNGDGLDELITQRNNGPTAAHAETVYDHDGNLILSAYSGLVTYYDNGYATAGWSHNQGRAGDKLWPYTLFLYDAGSGKYTRIASVDGWDRQYGDTYESFRPGHAGTLHFPDDVDKDGDGFVYYLITEDDGYAPAYGMPVDYAEWAEWAAAYLGGNVVEAAYVRLTEETIALIG